MGFTPPGNSAGENPATRAERIASAGIEATRRKFTPEFLNRIDKIVVFQPLDETELRKILDLELTVLNQRFDNSSYRTPFVLTVTDAAKRYLLQEGTDVRYGARPLKRAIERSLVHPISNLIATGQVQVGDWVCVDFDVELQDITFYKEAEDAMAEMAAIAAGTTSEAAAAVAVLTSTDSSLAKVRSIQRAIGWPCI